VAAQVTAAAAIPPTLSRANQRRRITIWLILLVLLGAGSWVLFGEDPYAQEVRDDVTGAETQTIVETPFSVKAHSFSYFKFTVPPGAVSVTVTGPFSAEGDPDNNIEAYILTDSAFVLWSKGYATSTHYESGKVTQGSMNVELPTGAGIYYLVFDNKFSPKAAKTIHATALLHYKTWIPEWLLRMKDRFWNSLGI
jgi:hypothetical protein